MADLEYIPRAARRIAQPGELDGIGMTGRALRQAGAAISPDGLTARAPLLDVRGFIDESRGVAAVGEAVQRVGSATMSLAVEQAEAVAERQAREAGMALDSIQSEMAAALASEPDELRYGEILESHIDRARSMIRDTPMMAKAKVDAEGTLAGWESRARGNVTLLQARRSFQRAGESIRADVINRRNNNDFAGARATLDTPSARKWLGEDTVASELGELDRAEKTAEARARREAVEQDAAATPEMWLERNPEPGGMDPDDWQAGQAMARRVLSVRVQDAAEEIGDALASGSIKTTEELERIAGGRLGPAALERAKDDLRKFQSEAWRSENLSEKGVTKNFGLLLGEVERYDKATDPDGSKYAALVWRVKTLMPEELRGEITQPLSRKWNPGNGPDAPAPLKGFVSETLGNWFKDGKFGKTQKQVMNPETFRNEWVDDPPARDEAAARRGAAEMEMQRWLRENPNASIREAKEQLLRTASASLLPGDVDKLLRRPVAPPADVDPATRIREIGMKFGGVHVPPTGDLGAARTTVFGGPNDPVDNGLSAFGGPTGEGGREGVAVPAKILRHFYGPNRADWERVQVEATLPDGTKKVLPIADLGTAEWVWRRDGKPVMDLTPGAVEALGGDVIEGKDGTLKGVKGLKGVRFRLLPLSDQTPPFSE